jgi:hypothetical protein
MISMRQRSDELVVWDHSAMRRRGELPAEGGAVLNGELVRYAYTAQPFGGERQWFCCPGCRSPRRVLYGAQPRCRECRSLVYASQYETWPTMKHINRALRVRRKLGGRGLAQPFPLKPKGMHWSTYDRLFQQEVRALSKCQV